MSGPGTSTIVGWYSPPCQSVGSRYNQAYRALDTVLHHHGYAPHAGTGAYNCRNSTGSTVKSTHALGPGDRYTFWSGIVVTEAGAVDINPDKNPYGPRLVTDMPTAMIRDIEAIRTVSGAQLFRWGGRYTGNKDPMHYEPVCEPHDLASGVNWSTVAGAAGAPSTGDDDMDEADWARLQKMLNDGLNNMAASLHRDIVTDQGLAEKLADLVNNPIRDDLQAIKNHLGIGT